MSRPLVLSALLAGAGLLLPVVAPSVAARATQDVPAVTPAAPSAPAQDGSAGPVTPTPSADAIVVGSEGLELYPRWSKAFPSLGRLAPGSVLDVQRAVGAWKEVVVHGAETRGWVHCAVAPPAARDASTLELPIAASPTTSGLVVKGFSPRGYALRNDGDATGLDALLARKLDARRFAGFLDADPPPPDGPDDGKAPVSSVLAAL
ncbi:MAG: hypothetical protein H6825_16400, partial [Planctomycetes bacterium]|nr:hypothetical protein [Planctomycetota bacterium]